MINHARTLLLNLPAAGTSVIAAPGEEYVPSNFAPQPLSPLLTSLRRLVFGGNPDRAMLNVRLAQFLTPLHATPLDPYLRSFDPRVTYLPPKAALFDTLAVGSTVSQIAGTAGYFYLSGSPVAQGDRLQQAWMVTVASSSTVSIAYRDNGGVTQTITLSYTTTNGLSNAIALPNSAMSFNFNATTGATFLVQAVAEPPDGPLEALARISAGMTTEIRQALFAGQPTLQQAFDEHWIPQFRLGAVLTALAFQIDAVRPAVRPLVFTKVVKTIAPANLHATAGNTTITLNWTAVAGALSYNVYRGTTSGEESVTPIATGVTMLYYLDSGLTNSETYYYVVTAVNTAGESPNSNEAFATPSATAGGRPIGLLLSLTYAD